MKIVMNRLEALSLAKAAESIAPSKATMDELRCVLLESGEDGKLTMAATNNEVALEQRMPAQIQEAGALLINAKLFANMLSVLGGETVTIQGEDGRQAEITSGTCRYYQCGARAWNSAEGCESVLIFEDELKTAVLESIRFQAQLARKLRKRMETCERRQHSGKGGKRELSLKKKLDGLDAQRKKLYLDYHAGTLNKAEFDAASEAISARWREYQQELAVHSAANGGPDAAVYREEMDTLIQLSNLRSLDREIVDRLIRTIRIFEDRRIEIVWNFSSPYAALIEGYERKDNHEGNK